MTVDRLHILNRLIERFGYRRYLEIGVAGGATFRHVEVYDKIGVDPHWRLWYALRPSVKKTTSDRFFAANRRRRRPRTFDLVFVDGLHHAPQVWTDLTHALEVLEPGGAVLLHDCSPTSEPMQRWPRSEVIWTGDVWRAFLKAAQDPNLETVLYDTDMGCGLVRPGRRAADAPAPPADLDPLDPALTWEEYEAHKDRWLRIVPPAQVSAELDRLSPPGGD